MDIWAFIDRNESVSTVELQRRRSKDEKHTLKHGSQNFLAILAHECQQRAGQCQQCQQRRCDARTQGHWGCILSRRYVEAGQFVIETTVHFRCISAADHGWRSITGDGRPRTPPSLTRNKSTPPPTLAPSATPTTRRAYTNLGNNTWTTGEDAIRNEDDRFGLDEDEDEFGLPSIASMRRKGRRLTSRKGKDAGGGASSNTNWASTAFERQDSDTQNNGIPAPTTLASWAVDNGDVAEVRAIPSYPSAKRSAEGQKILRPQYKDILRDPANSLHLISHPPAPAGASAKETEAQSARITRINKFKKLLQASSISLPDLRASAWSGLPSEVRAMSWQLLLGYLPTSSERRVAALERKRREYLDGVRQAFERGTPISPVAGAGSSSPVAARSRGRGLDEAIWHQISIDVPRTNPHLELYGYEATQRSLERILYVWAIRHPASGYVQGINDLVTPFWQVFLGQYITDSDVEFGMDPGQLPKAVLDAVEADSFWCLTKLLDGIQDNYIHAQPGIQRQVSALRDLTSRIDEALAKHMEHEGVEFIQFSFRWMNCLLMREVSVKNTVRMWDTYLVSVLFELCKLPMLTLQYPAG